MSTVGMKQLQSDQEEENTSATFVGSLGVNSHAFLLSAYVAWTFCVCLSVPEEDVFAGMVGRL